jgi:o-succinylbenzoate---CoA ligase
VLVDAWLPRAARLRPEHPALVVPEGTVSYSELHARALSAAAWLAGRGAGPGVRVAIVLPPGLAFAEALHGCLLLGAIATPIDPRLAPPERAERAAGAGVVVEEPLRGGQEVGAALSETHDLDAPALRMHTSGTTAAPRPVELTYGNVLWSAAGSAFALGVDPADRWLCAMPVAHVGGLSILLRSAIYATTAVVHPRFDAAAVLAEEGLTLLSLVPTMLARLLDAGLERPPSLRCALVGGAPAPAPLLARAAAAGVPVAQTYGLTEAASQVTTSPPGDPSTAGAPLLPTRVRIAPDGEILVAGPTVAPGAAGPDGWLHTGDEGALDERGRLTVTGRRSETIVTGGENVAPAEVEAVLMGHPAVADAGVHGRPDPEWGEAVIATVVPREGARIDAEELRAYCAGQLAAFKVPKRFEVTPALPRTESGKLLRRELRRST